MTLSKITVKKTRKTVSQTSRKSPAATRKTSRPSSRSAAPKVFDVARPGKTAAQSTSRPVIISNRPVITDPMVKETASESVSAPVLPSAKKKVITPLHHITTEAPVAAPVEATIAQTTPAGVPTEAETEPSGDALPVASPTSMDTESLREVVTDLSQAAEQAVPTQSPHVADSMVRRPSDEAEQVTTPVNQPSNTSIAIPVEGLDTQLVAKVASKDSTIKNERASELANLIEKESYFLPINAKEDRRNKRLAVAGLVLVVILGAAWYNTALDAGLLPNTYKLPHSHFFTAK